MRYCRGETPSLKMHLYGKWEVHSLGVGHGLEMALPLFAGSQVSPEPLQPGQRALGALSPTQPFPEAIPTEVGKLSSDQPTGQWHLYTQPLASEWVTSGPEVPVGLAGTLCVSTLAQSFLPSAAAQEPPGAGPEVAPQTHTKPPLQGLPGEADPKHQLWDPGHCP